MEAPRTRARSQSTLAVPHMDPITKAEEARTSRSRRRAFRRDRDRPRRHAASPVLGLTDGEQIKQAEQAEAAALTASKAAVAFMAGMSALGQKQTFGRDKGCPLHP